MERQKDRQTLIHRALPATARGRKSIKFHNEPNKNNVYDKTLCEESHLSNFFQMCWYDDQITGWETNHNIPISKPLISHDVTITRLKEENKVACGGLNGENLFFILLTHFMSLASFYTPWKQRFSDVFREYRNRPLARKELRSSLISHWPLFLTKIRLSLCFIHSSFITSFLYELKQKYVTLCVLLFK